MPGFEPVSAAVDAAVNLGKIGYGIAQEVKANKLNRNLVRPEYRVQQPILDNQALAERNAAQGLSDAARTSLQNGADRGLTTAYDALLRGGAGVNSFADLYNNYADHFDKVALMEEDIRARNQQVYLQQNEKLAGELDKAWMWNEQAPYQDQKQLVAELRRSGAQNIWAGVDGMAAGVQRQATMQLFKKDGLFGTPETTNPTAQARGPITYPDQGSFMGSSGKFADPARANIFSQVAQKYMGTAQNYVRQSGTQFALSQALQTLLK